MHFTTIFILGAAVVSASSSLVARQSLPQCYVTCIQNADFEGCAATDNVCLCSNSKFIAATTTCVESACQGDDLTNALATAQAICAKVGVPLTASSIPIPTSTGASSSSTSAASASSSGSAPASTSNAAAAAHGSNAFIGLAAVGLVALAL